jgi:hypothetical protein
MELTAASVEFSGDAPDQRGTDGRVS